MSTWFLKKSLGVEKHARKKYKRDLFSLRENVTVKKEGEPDESWRHERRLTEDVAASGSSVTAAAAVSTLISYL